MKERYIVMAVTPKMINIAMLMPILMLAGCSVNNDQGEIDDATVDAVESISENLIDNQAEINENLKNYEGVWQRTGVERYQAAEIRISNWKEESFDVVLYTSYNNTSGGSLRGTATFLDDDIAVLYDEEVEALIQDFFQDQVEDSGIYFQLQKITL